MCSISQECPSLGSQTCFICNKNKATQIPIFRRNTWNTDNYPRTIKRVMLANHISLVTLLSRQQHSHLPLHDKQKCRVTGAVHSAERNTRRNRVGERGEGKNREVKLEKGEDRSSPMMQSSYAVGYQSGAKAQSPEPCCS